MASVLEIQNLQVSYRSHEVRSRPVLSGVSFDLMPGEILGVLGESGSGKSTLAASVLRLLPPNGQIEKGAVIYEGHNLFQANPEELRQIRGSRIALIFQEPSLALHPTIRVGEQVRQVLAAHQQPSKKLDLNRRTREVFTQLLPQDTDRILSSYPHQLSGGQRQRALCSFHRQPALCPAASSASSVAGLHRLVFRCANIAQVKAYRTHQVVAQCVSRPGSRSVCASCGTGTSSGPPPTQGTPAGTYTITVNGTSGSLSLSASYQLVVK